MKKWSSILLIVTLLLCIIPLSVSANGTTSDGSEKDNDISFSELEGGSSECSHTGGEATCTQKAICDLCQQPYGELKAHTPVANTEKNAAATCGKPGWKDATVCDVCGTTVDEGSEVPATGLHTGGTATCTEKSICDVCQQPYGELVTHTAMGWVLDGGRWKYTWNDGCVTAECVGWKEDSTGWCYVGEDGFMVTERWVLDSVGWCYVGADGYCVTDCWMQDSIGWCYLDGEGRMATNRWILDSVGWCYVGADGYCVTNCWMQDSIGWCYLDGEGRMATNRWIMDSVGWCYVGADGYCITNAWMADSIGWCYLDGDGRMVVNDYVRDSSGLCYLDANGYWDGIYR